ncbi:serine hydrolase domain-containing protein [Gemmatimonadota bacterium]
MPTSVLRAVAPQRVFPMLLGIVVLSAVVLYAQDPARRGFSLEQIDSYVAARLERGRIPGAALVIVLGDRILHMQTWGIADPSGRPVTQDTPFILGSTTKSITATAVMMAIETGLIDLNTPVREYLPWFRTANATASARITVRHLLNHTSGLSEAIGRERLADGDTSALALDRHVRALSEKQLVSEPGTSFDYSNANYAILGRILQEVSGGTFEAFIQENIFEPLQMEHSFTSQRAAERDGMATGYRYWFGFPRPAPDVPFVRGVAPAGYLISSARDLARYLTLHLNYGTYEGTSLISPERVEELHRPTARMAENMSYAMGWLNETNAEDVTVWHNGGLSNFYSYLGMLPERRLGVVFLANGLDILSGAQFDAIPRGVVEMLRREEPEVPADVRFHPPINVAVLWALLILIWQAGWISLSAWKRRPWTVSPEHIPISASTELRKFGLPLLLNYGWACIVVLAVPGGQGIPFNVMKLYVPDFGLLAQMSAGIAVVWGTAQVVLRLLSLGQAVGR